jgi:ATP-dependent exoDNAse (exonuclease V) beta subunit
MLGDDDDAASEAMAAVLSQLDNDLGRVRELIVRMLQSREQWMRIMERGGGRTVRSELESALQAVIRLELAALRNVVDQNLPKALRPTLFGYMHHAAGNLPELEPLAAIASLPGTEATDVTTWRAFCNFLFTNDHTLRKRLTRDNGFPSSDPATREACKEFITDLAARGFEQATAKHFQHLWILPPPCYSDEDWRFVEALFVILPRAVEHLRAIFAAEGHVDFSEVAQGALRALGTPDRPSDLAHALTVGIQHILVDEFQDTSVLQVELLHRLSAEWKPGDGHTLFVVGDPMQSIYGFREAEVVLFERTRRTGIGSHGLDAENLTTNFRSQSLLVEWFNQTFPLILTEQDDVTGAVQYVPADAQNGESAKPAVEIHAWQENDAAAEGQRVADLVQAALDEDDKGSIAVLVRARNHLGEIVKALRARAIGFRAVKIDPLGQRQAVLDVHALTHALLQLADRTSWLAVLRAPWCGLEIADLLVLCQGDATSTVWDLLHQRISQLSIAGRARVERVIKVVEEAFASRYRVGLRNWVEGVWIGLGGPAAVRAGADGEADLRDVAAYFDLLQSCELAGDLADRAGFERKLEQLYAAADTSDGIRVDLMTVHNAKGLEFDTVILPGLGRRTAGDEKRLMYWRERPLDGRTRLLLAPIAPTSARMKDEVTIEKYICEIEKERGDEEEKRLLYVAATRAKRKLHLLGQIRKPDAKPSAGSPLQLLFAVPAIEAEFKRENSGEEIQADEVRDTSDAPRAVPTLRRLSVNWNLPEPPQPLTWHVMDSASPSELPPHLFQWASERRRVIGTVTHAFLLQIARDGVARWTEQTIAARAPEIRAALLARGLPSDDIASSAAEVTAALRKTLGDKRGRWLLHAHDEAASELSLSGVLDGKLYDVRIDRTFIENGIRWIVDYKLASIEGGSRDAFIKAQVEKYRPDLELYAKLMSRFDPRPLRCALYFPLLSEFAVL